MSPRIIIIAGPNGAVKTTFATEYLPHEAACPQFINADLIAAGLSPFDPAAAAIQAGRLMLAEIERHIQAHDSFAFETTLSGRSYARRIPKWQAAGYRVKLMFLQLQSVRLALARVKERIAHGGHAIPSSVVRRRFRNGWQNFNQVYRSIVDEWELYDNSGGETLLLAKGSRK